MSDAILPNWALWKILVISVNTASLVPSSVEQAYVIQRVWQPTRPLLACDVFAVYSESVSVAVLLAVFGSGTLFGEVTVTVSEIDPLADPAIVPLAL